MTERRRCVVTIPWETLRVMPPRAREYMSEKIKEWWQGGGETPLVLPGGSKVRYLSDRWEHDVLITGRDSDVLREAIQERQVEGWQVAGLSTQTDGHTVVLKRPAPLEVSEVDVVVAPEEAND